jgi:hypothetical protein
MAKVWTVEITGGADVPPGLVSLCTSRRKALEAAREWAHLPKGSKAIKWEHSEDGRAFGVLDSRDEPDEEEAEPTDPYYLSIRQWSVR